MDRYIHTYRYIDRYIDIYADICCSGGAVNGAIGMQPGRALGTIGGGSSLVGGFTSMEDDRRSGLCLCLCLCVVLCV
jgi:hypothetical protein